MATAGFSMTTKGCTIRKYGSELESAIPLKKHATPIPSGIHIFSKREEINSIKDNTGMEVKNEYTANYRSILISNVPCGRSVMPIFTNARFCKTTAIRRSIVRIKNLHR